MSIELNDVAGGSVSISALNNNFQKIEDWINLNGLWRQGVEAGQANQMETNLDMNGFAILNTAYDPDEPDSLLTLAGGDERYVNVSGDTMVGGLNVRLPVASTEPARKGQLDQERKERQDNDASLQSQIVGASPLMAAERPVISWHSQVLNNSVAIPDNVNAFSAGPEITLDDGVVVTLGNNSFYSIFSEA